MKIPAPMMPPITAMVVPNRPRWRARPLPGEDGTLGISREVTVPSLRSAHLREFVKVFGVGKRGAVHALHPGIAGLDHVILIGRMRPVAVAESEMPGGQAKGLAGENVTRPGARQPRKGHRVDAVLFIHGGGGANDGGIGGRGSGVVAADSAVIRAAAAVYKKNGIDP